MKNKLRIIFFLLSGICYLSQSLELDRNEAKQNYVKEIHSPVPAIKATENQQIVFAVAKLPAINLKDLLNHITFLQQYCKALNYNNSSPPPLYLLHNILII